MRFITESDGAAFAASLLRAERSAATAAKYRREAEAFIRWLGGRAASQDLAVEYKARLAQERTAAGVNGAVAALNKFFDFLGLADCRLKAARVQRQTFRDSGRELSQAEYKRLLAAAGRRDRRLLLVMETICATGIRVSELRFFTLEAVRAGKTVVTNKGKTRDVYLPGKLRRLLLDYARERKIAAGPVFVTQGGKPLDRSNLWRAMKRLCALAGVAAKKVFPHNLRHLFARTYYALEKDVVRLADILGHSNINTTRLYTLDTGETHRRRLDRLQLLL